MNRVQQAVPVNWPPLQQQAAPYTTLVSVQDPVSGLIDVTYCGLKTNLSDVLKDQPASGVHSVAIFADTLVLDVPTVATSGLLLVVRNIDTSALAGQPFRATPGANGEFMAQVLVGAAVGGTFSLGVTGQDGQVSPAVGSDALTASTYLAARNEPLSLLPPSPGNNLASLLDYSWNINSLYASFSAAAWLMDDPANSSTNDTAKAMLAWVVTSTASLATQQQLPSNYGQLYNQAAALLVTLNVASGATFVPVLSSTYYSQHMNDILVVIRDYEGQLQTLDTQQDIAQAIATVSATLAGVASDEVAPLQAQLDSINLNTQSLFNDIVQLRGQFLLQTQRAHTAFQILGTEITLDSIRAQLSAEMDLAMSVISLGFNAVKLYEGDPSALKDAISDSVDAIKGLVATIDAGQQGSTDDMSTQASALLQSQSALMETVLNGRLLWQQALDQHSGGILPASLASITIDPVTDWDNYMATAEAKISTLERSIGGNAQAAADTYLASLKILAGYGKAIGGKYVAYVAQLVQATIVIAQIKAANDVEARWQATLQNATSDAQKLVALKALIQGRLQAIKRSLYLAWSYYAASYFYLNFQAPPRTVHLDMDAAALGAALVGVADWVAAAQGNAPAGQSVQLPSTNAHIELDFAILPVGGDSPTGDAALLDKTADGGWSLTFTVPLGTPQLDGVLPNQGQCAIWLSQAAFFLDGVTANSKGNVIASVSTSGTYQNGLGSKGDFTFVTKPLSGNYAYHVPDLDVYSPWAINTAVYMTPTPYTQWSIVLAPGSGDPSSATRLRVKLLIAYLS
ncbi:MAG: hypothetical protein ABWY06_03975 [Pseudomonas sp.]|uniref:hypothetical protein n=1 Tax=Pseudomonas sp. TaxID=306 RepID=UPI0033920555